MADLGLAKWCSGNALRAGALLTVFMNCPYYHRQWFHPEMAGVNWPSFFEQVESPFVDHSPKHPALHHATKLGFRFVPAVLCKVLGANTVRGALLFQLAAQYALCTLVFVVLRRGARSPVQALAAAVPFCLVAGGHPFWQDEWGFFDTVAIAFIVAAWHVRQSGWSMLLLLLAFFSDERAVIASPIMLLPPTGIVRHDWSAHSILAVRLPWYVLVLLTYGAMRWAMGLLLGLRTEPVGPEYFLGQLHLLPYAFLHGHEGFLLMTALALVVMRKQRLYLASATLLCGTLAVWLAAVWVIDLERSMGYLLPYLIASTIVVRSATSTRHFALLIAAVTALNLLHSDSLTLPEQLVHHFTGDTPGHMVRMWLGRP